MHVHSVLRRKDDGKECKDTVDSMRRALVQQDRPVSPNGEG